MNATPDVDTGRRRGRGAMVARDVLSLRWQDFRAAVSAQPAAFKWALAYLVIEYVRPQSVWPAIDVLPWAQISIIVASILVFSERNTRPLVSAPSNGLMIAFSLAVLASIATAYSKSDSYYYWDMFLPWLIVYFMLINAVDNRERFIVFLLVYLACSLKMSQHGFRSWAMSGFGFTSWGVTGAPGWFRNSGEVGIQMCIFLPMSLHFVYAVRERISKLKFYIACLLPVTAAGTIIAANSRGAILGALAAFAWMAIFSRYRVRAIVGTVVVAVIGYLILPDEFIDRFTRMGTDATSLTRLAYWKAGLKMLMDHPITGIGYWNWGAYYTAFFPMPVEGYYKGVELPHNILVQIGAELGFLGLAPYLGLIVSTFVMNARSRALALSANDTFLVTMARGFDAGMVGFLVSGQFVSVAYYPYLWIGAAMTVMLYAAARDSAGCSPETGLPLGEGGRRRVRVRVRKGIGRARPARAARVTDARGTSHAPRHVVSILTMMLVAATTSISDALRSACGERRHRRRALTGGSADVRCAG